MKKLLFITILILLLYSISASATPSFNIIEDFVNQTSGAGQTVSSGSFNVNNTGTTNLDINFTGYTLTNGSNTLSIISLSNITNLGNGSSAAKTFSVVIPSQQRPGLYTGTLTGTSNSSNTDTATINVNVTGTYSASTLPSSINLGSATLNTTRTREFNITNTGNDDITNVSFTFSKSAFNLQSNKTNFVLPFNKTESIKFNITIPADSSTGNVTLGSVNIASTELNAALFNVKANVGGGLIIDELDVFITTRDSESESDLEVVDGKKLDFDEEDIGPGTEVRFNFDIENTFTNEEDIDITDITIKITIEEIDDGDDLDEESDEFNLDADDNENVDIFFNIPLSVDEGKYDVIIEVEGEDDNGNTHTVQWELELNVDKENREVVVGHASLFPETVKCSGTSTLTATIKNLGTKTEDEAKIEITNSDLGINFVKQDIELEEDPFDTDNEYTKKLVININTATSAGTYPILVNSYINDEILWERKTINLVVEGCEAKEEEEEKTEEETVDVETGKEKEEETTTSESIPVLNPTITTEVPLTKKPGFWFIIVVLNVIIIGGAVFYIYNIVAKKP
ncbi:MAG TPA: hypothetical protein QGI22_03200 [Candidatus Woesearchaeota archaeon]|jgi:hypothetical protein|nr:hypothetical protein [Candidatus Woesearchaeota archaeon]HJN56944.1 hypothetical protein [Candidatus Woesearchaeota archaeon]|tara:strand:- start:520 stop:2232 length:1713 start_codon:yes stop_codon:yes gene_type:complete